MRKIAITLLTAIIVALPALVPAEIKFTERAELRPLQDGHST